MTCRRIRRNSGRFLANGWKEVLPVLVVAVFIPLTTVQVCGCQPRAFPDNYHATINPCTVVDDYNQAITRFNNDLLLLQSINPKAGVNDTYAVSLLDLAQERLSEANTSLEQGLNATAASYIAAANAYMDQAEVEIERLSNLARNRVLVTSALTVIGIGTLGVVIFVFIAYRKRVVKQEKESVMAMEIDYSKIGVDGNGMAPE
ncbi:MAG: hypothetical protein ACTSUE_06725 [Promethearchaeota archaeon]